MTSRIECVPNISEGRRAEVVGRAAAAVMSVPGVRLLDQHSDADHDRSVLTFAGPADAVADAALALMEVAIHAIDLRGHRGVHPRLGAVDVIPFIPLAGSTMDECVDVAHRVGREIAARHDVPVYFYGNAALRPDRARLSDIRRPRFEGLAELIETTHTPDAGPARVHPTGGAVAVGARPPLVAFNVELASSDVRLAQSIAREIRESSGGLPGVQAMGVLLSNPPRAQVSCNLTDPLATSLLALFQAIASRAAAVGVEVRKSELVGLVPLDVALGVTGAALRLDGFEQSRVLELRLLESS